MWEQLRGGRRRLQAARGLGAPRPAGDRRLATGWPTRPGVQVNIHTGHPERGPASSRETLRAIGADDPFTPITPKAPAAGTRPRHSSPSPSHPKRAALVDQPPLGRTRRTRCPSTLEHAWMVCHHPQLRRCRRIWPSRRAAIRPSTMAAEGPVCTDLGAISIIGSDSQAMGRVGEVILRTLADRACDEGRARGSLPGDGPADNLRAPAGTWPKYTICPAVGNRASTPRSARSRRGQARRFWCCGNRRFFGRCGPHLVVQGRRHRLGRPWAMPKRVHPHTAADPGRGRWFGRLRCGAGQDPAWRSSRRRPSLTTLASPVGRLARQLSPVADTRRRGKADMPCNDAHAPHRGSSRTRSPYGWTGRSSNPKPPVELPMAQRYFLF